VQDHTLFSSPFSWRYGSDAMRRVWSLTETRRLWRRLWVALAEAQAEIGLVTAEQVADLRAHQDDIDLERAHELEASLSHDLMAEVHTYAEQCPIGGGIIHLGATSMDIEDNAEALKIRAGLDVLIEGLAALLRVISARIEQEADRVCMAYTHLQPAEPTTVGYRLAFVAQDMLADYEDLLSLRESIRGKGFKGAVGTSASYEALLEGRGMSAAELEARIMARLGLPAYDVTHQTYPRRQDWQVLNALASVAMTAYKFAFDLRLLQAPSIGEWREPFGSRQIGSSAMPFKRNPIHAENIDSLARYVAALPRVAWDNAAHHLLERTLDDSANRRALLPEAFLAVDEIISRTTRLMRHMVIDEDGIRRNLAMYGPFAGTERLLMTASKRGGDRQVLHEAIRECALRAWNEVQQGRANPLTALLSADERITAYVKADEIPALLHAGDHIGDAPQRARRLAERIRQKVG